ncbi:MAG: histidinol dehydrogenase [Kiritimatiellaeota bacterium]|nr:histidinol dehydrogenase [Kiritimatiellota bacterium]
MPEAQPRVVRWSPAKSCEAVDALLNRPAFEPEAERVAGEVLEAIRTGGDEAVARYIKQFDGADLAPAQFRVASGEIKAAYEAVDLEFKRAATEAYQRIIKFSKAGLRRDWSLSSPKGGLLGEQFAPLARVADVREVVACTPAGRDGAVNPFLLYALDLAGATEIYKVGGIQAIGALAYGTPTIRKVQKIVGPGGPYVTAAKRLVYGRVELDLVAGPSEIAILADETAAAACVAADLLSQAEHGTGLEKALLVTTSAALVREVQAELVRQAAALSRRAAIERVLERGLLLVLVDNLAAGMELCNRFAPEHLEIMVREPRSWTCKVRAAGAVFIGPWTPECAGDFVAGPSHVLPTGGMAAVFSGLTVDSFRRRTSVIALTRADLMEMLPTIEAFARVEQLDGHARSARVRFETGK